MLNTRHLFGYCKHSCSSHMRAAIDVVRCELWFITHALFQMSRRFSLSSVVQFFSIDDDAAFSEFVFEGSDDELGMEDEEQCDTEPAFVPFQVSDQGKLEHCCTYK